MFSLVETLSSINTTSGSEPFVQPDWSEARGTRVVFRLQCSQGDTSGLQIVVKPGGHEWSSDCSVARGTRVVLRLERSQGDTSGLQIGAQLGGHEWSSDCSIARGTRVVFRLERSQGDTSGLQIGAQPGGHEWSSDWSLENAIFILFQYASQFTYMVFSYCKFLYEMSQTSWTYSTSFAFLYWV